MTDLGPPGIFRIVLTCADRYSFRLWSECRERTRYFRLAGTLLWLLCCPGKTGYYSYHPEDSSICGYQAIQSTAAETGRLSTPPKTASVILNQVAEQPRS